MTGLAAKPTWQTPQVKERGLQCVSHLHESETQEEYKQSRHGPPLCGLHGWLHSGWPDCQAGERGIASCLLICRRLRGKKIQSQLFGKELSCEPTFNAIPGIVEGWGESAEAALSRGDGYHSTANPALAG
jgi:hypothetical protein